jgi:hypothetical protein
VGRYSTLKHRSYTAMKRPLNALLCPPCESQPAAPLKEAVNFLYFSLKIKSPILWRKYEESMQQK